MSRMDVKAMIDEVERLLAASDVESAIRKLLNLVESLNAENEAMLPLESILFVPSLIVTPLAIAALLFLRRTKIYARLWPYGVIVCMLLCGLFLGQVLATSDYGQRRTANPGGFSSSVTTVIAVYLLETCLVIPAFPVLIALAFLTPRDWKRRTRLFWIVFCLTFVGVLAWLILQRNREYLADYRQAQQQKLQQGDQFKHLRRP